MPFLEALKLALAAIFGHKLRSFLTLLGVIFGVATVIVVVSLVEGFNAYVDEKIANIGTNAFAVSKFSIDDFSSVEALNAARRRNKRSDARRRRGPARSRRRDSRCRRERRCARRCKVWLDQSLARAHQRHHRQTSPTSNESKPVKGRYFNKGEDDTRRNVSFIGADVADKLFPPINPLGQTIRIDGRAFEVIGVGKALGSVFGQPQDMYVAMPLSTFLALYGSRRSLSLSVTSTSAETLSGRRR